MRRHIRIALVLGAALAAASLAAALSGQSSYALPQGLYVNAATGSDSTNCGAHTGNACRTIQAAIDQIPPMSRGDILVRIGPGDYDGGIVIAGREMQGSSRITLSGEPGLTRLISRGGEPIGISIRRSGGVVLKNLEITGFPQAGVKVLLSSGIEVRSTTLTDNLDGLLLGESETFIHESVIQLNLRYGISCEGGWVVFTHDKADSGLVLTDNAVAGLLADRCRARFESPGLIAGSPIGLLARNGGDIDLNMRGDVSLIAAEGQIALNADCHGMIEGYGRACVGDCACQVSRCGLCISSLTTGPAGGGTGTRLDEPN